MWKLQFYFKFSFTVYPSKEISEVFGAKVFPVQSQHMIDDMEPIMPALKPDNGDRSGVKVTDRGTRGLQPPEEDAIELESPDEE